MQLTTAQSVLRTAGQLLRRVAEGRGLTISQYDTVAWQFVPWTGNGTGTLTTDKNGRAVPGCADARPQAA